MANDSLLSGNDIEDYDVMYGSRSLRGLALDGDAITSTKLTAPQPPVEGSDGIVCRGARGSRTEILTIRVLRGSPADVYLKAQINAEATTFSIRRRGSDAVGDQYFSNCAYVESEEGGIRLGRDGEKYKEYTVNVILPIDNDLTFVNLGL